MPAVPANKPRDKVIHLPAPRASLGTADKIPSTNLVAKAPVKFIFQKMNTAILVWFIMTSGKNHSGCSRRQEWHWSTPGLDVPGLIPLLNHSVLKSEARHHSFHAVRLKSLKKISSLSSFQHIWIKVTVKYTECITDGLLWNRAAEHIKGMDTQSVSQQWIMERESKAKPSHISSSFHFTARKKPSLQLLKFGVKRNP